MEKNVLFLLVTNFLCVDEKGVSYAFKEMDLKKDLGIEAERTRFFHQRFQSRDSTLARILREEKETKINVLFHKEVPPKKSIKVIKHVCGVIEKEKVVFSSILV